MESISFTPSETIVGGIAIVALVMSFVAVCGNPSLPEFRRVLAASMGVGAFTFIGLAAVTFWMVTMEQVPRMGGYAFWIPIGCILISATLVTGACVVRYADFN